VKRMPLVPALAAALLAAGGLARAQDLEAEVVREPDADLATYTLDFEGPPSGVAFLFGGLSVTQQPFQLPGILHPLYLDPFGSFPLGGAVPLGPSGLTDYEFLLPMTELQDVHLHFQCVALDVAGVLAASNLASGIQGAAPLAGAPPLEWSGSYRTAPDVYTLKVTGQPGANVRLLVNGGQKAEGQVVLDANGEATVEVPVTLEQGDGLTIEVDGQPVHGWSWD